MAPSLSWLIGWGLLYDLAEVFQAFVDHHCWIGGEGWGRGALFSARGHCSSECVVPLACCFVISLNISYFSATLIGSFTSSLRNYICHRRVYRPAFSMEMAQINKIAFINKDHCLIPFFFPKYIKETHIEIFQYVYARHISYNSSSTTWIL